MDTFVRRAAGSNAEEIFINLAPTPDTELADQLEELYSTAKELLAASNAKVLQERFFGTDSAAQQASTARARLLADFDDGVPPTYLSVPAGIRGEISGIHIHAVTGDCTVTPIEHEGKKVGRICTTLDRKFMTVSGITGDPSTDPATQTQQMLTAAEAILKQNNVDLLAVPRTWMWLGDILDWYDDFNEVRTAFFVERGMIAKGKPSRMPASTGIGIGPAGPCICAMEFTAVLEPAGGLEYLDAGGNQHSAFEYGSAFSRAASALTPAGETIYVSGTASIDESGATTNIDDAPAQIDATIENIQAILRDEGTSENGITFGFVYCKTAEIERQFCEKWSNFDWPAFTMIADVCRHDLLFEIEATAIKP
ncbi:putative endoribonuclease L-PSP [Anaerohalosphaera lusitana]|uniref:Putative endoribonuclease L-PSP n=1 Tax=Anaerohalosphaera lusitana TaxID=1936003 RepID=A0A1U9NIA2_9BACT|nr:hypothetical protein [Anaerohalosphaera lusitana]AQT67454.1 putative endoribonuclease L-PSP [Anaerohalosphaera lusitana]